MRESERETCISIGNSTSWITNIQGAKYNDDMRQCLIGQEGHHIKTRTCHYLEEAVL